MRTAKAKRTRILVADDEPKIVAFVQSGLEDAGYHVCTCCNGDDALALATTGQFHAIVLDIMMPQRDGLAVLRELRRRQCALPIILLTARTTVADRVDGLNLGADDYLPKPFAVDELVARLGAVSRRRSGEELLVLRYRDLELHLGTRVVRRGTRTAELTTREFALLEYLLRAPEHVHTRSDLCRHVWGYQPDSNLNLVDVCLQRLRRKVDSDHPQPLLHTVRGVGYALRAAS